MRILHLFKDYYPVLGGIENYLRLLAEAQVKNGHQVTALVTGPGMATREEDLNGVHIIKAGRLATVASTPLSLSLPLQLRRQAPDVTHVHTPYPLAELAQWALGRRPYVVTYHAEPTRPLQRLVLRAYAPFYRRYLAGAARILVTSPNYAVSSPYLGACAERLSVTPLGIDVTRFTPAIRPAGQPPTVLFVGLLRHYKGVDHLIRAMALLPPEARLLIAGEGPQRPRWEKIGQALGLAGRVQFLGRVPDAELPALYHRADVFVLPAVNRAEAFGAVLLEAMASGLPCVTSEIGSGTSYVVQHGVTGLVVPPRSPAALAEALQTLLHDPARRAQMGKAGRERVQQEFTLDRLVRNVEEIYQAVAGQ